MTFKFTVLYNNICRKKNYIKNTGKGTKSLIFLKTVSFSVPTVLSLDNGDTLINFYDIANTFTNYFASIAETTKKILLTPLIITLRL